MLYDFHTHTFLSDGELSPIELIRRAFVKGYTAIGVTDHVGVGSLRRVITELKDDCTLAQAHWNILAIPGVELTHLPVPAIAETAYKAKELGAKLVIVHGETSREPVEKGTNLAALQSPHVDILAHPGLITEEEATLASKNGIFLELTSRQGHSLTNTHVALIAQQTGAALLVNSDAHADIDLLTPSLVTATISEINLTEQQLNQVLVKNPQLLIQRIKKND